MSETLLPCPFCGGINLYLDGYEHGSGLRWCVTCLDCMAKVDPGTIQQKYRAIAAWNRRADDWIPVSERLPEEGEIVIAYNGGFIKMVLNMFDAMEGATHWMPMPSPPKTDREVSE